MPKPSTILTSLITGVLFVAACAAASADPGSPHRPVVVAATVESPSTTTTTINYRAVGRWAAAVARNEQAARTTTTTTTIAARPSPTRSATSSSGCAYEAQIRAAFPGDGDWAISIAWRESRCQPGAVNHAETCAPGGSHAMGLFQMCYPLHAPTFAAVGCSDPLNAECNIRAAAHLYAGAGRGPWGLG